MMLFQRSELFLITMIVLFFFLALLFLMLLIISRISKINVIKKRKIFEPLADNAIFSVIFEDKTYQELLNDEEYGANFNDDFFRLLLLESVIKLHKSYTGEFASKIEAFYTESSLIDETYSKMDAFNWSVKCEAIGELAEMNIKEATGQISKYIASKNLILRQEAIKGIAKLNGVEGLSFLKTYKEPLSDWIQLNLLAIIKTNLQVNLEPYYLSFMSSENPTVVTFGKRLKTYYEQNDKKFAEVNEITPPDSDDVNSFYNTKRENQVKLAISFKQRKRPIILLVLKKVANLSFGLFIYFLISHLIELLINKTALMPIVFYYSLLNDIYTTLLIAMVTLPLAFIFIFIWRQGFGYIINLVYWFIFIIHTFLTIYFFKTKVPLGSDLFGYSLYEIIFTSDSSGGTSFSMIFFLLFVFSLIAFFIYIVNKFPIFQPQKIKKFSLILISIFFISWFFKTDRINRIDEFGNYIAINKTSFFFENESEYNSHKIENTFVDDKQYYIASDSASTEIYINDDYPFLKTLSKRNTLAPFFKDFSSDTKPNIVFILLEGMGQDFVGKDAKLGSFTPFLDSLCDKSLFWKNALSTGGRTFAALPSIFGSLPFLQQGYLEEGQTAPNANSLFKILSQNEYHSQYYTGSSASFDKQDIFLKAHGVDITLEKGKFGKEYHLLPSSSKGFSWGYGDKELFTQYFKLKKRKSPNISVFFTSANRSPYLIPNQDKYIEKVKKRIEQSSISTDKKEFLKDYLKELSCMLYTDDALKYFFTTFSKQEAFKNTIFIITGDHRAPEIPISFQIDPFRVPLVIYSPLLKRTGTFKSVVSHFDLTPSILALLSDVVKQPTANSWIGTLLDTNTIYSCSKQIPLMRTKNELLDFIENGYLLSENNVFKMTENLDLVPIEDEKKKMELTEQFNIFKQKNHLVYETKKLIPDSIFNFQNLILIKKGSTK